MCSIPYVSTCGSLMHVVVSMRPNIVHDVGIVSMFTFSLGKAHRHVVKSIIQELKGTKSKKRKDILFILFFPKREKIF